MSYPIFKFTFCFRKVNSKVNCFRKLIPTQADNVKNRLQLKTNQNSPVIQIP